MQDIVRTLTTYCRADVICLQETKISGISRGTILSMLGSDFSFWVELPATGESGGILVAWRHVLGPANSTRLDNHSASASSFLPPIYRIGGSLVYIFLREMTIKSVFCKNLEG